MLAVGAVLAASVALALGAAKTTLPALVAFLGSRDAARLRRAGRHRVRRRGGGTRGRHRLAGRDPLRGRSVDVVAAAASVAVPATLLSTVGVVVTAGDHRRFAHALFDLSWPESFLLGAVVASTDAAAVFATLRRTRLRRGLARTLEAESGGNDPVAIALTLGLIAWIEQPHYGVGDLAVLLVKQIGIGLVVRDRDRRARDVGLRAHPAGDRRRSRRSHPPRPPRSRSAPPTWSHGSGFLAVYLVGLAVGSTPSRYRGQLVTFHEGVAYVAQVALFIVLGLLVFPSRPAARRARGPRRSLPR